jgi:predicted RNA binding protein with dsRBD fold (UPF0201 family)
MTKEQVIELAKQAGFNASVGKTDKEGNYHPYVNAIGRDVPFEWVERFYALVRNAALEDANRTRITQGRHYQSQCLEVDHQSASSADTHV